MPFRFLSSSSKIKKLYISLSTWLKIVLWAATIVVLPSLVYKNIIITINTFDQAPQYFLVYKLIFKSFNLSFLSAEIVHILFLFLIVWILVFWLIFASSKL